MWSTWDGLSVLRVPDYLKTVLRKCCTCLFAKYKPKSKIAYEKVDYVWVN